eukprot:6438221-Heterocapsa_arctica.AAC.1
MGCCSCKRRRTGDAGDTADTGPDVTGDTGDTADIGPGVTGGAGDTASVGPGVSAQVTPADRRWARLARHARRVRQLQRLFGYLGQALQWYPGSLRNRLRSVDPTDYQRRHGAGRR